MGTHAVRPPVSVRLASGLLAAGGARRWLAPTPEALIAAARRRTGLSDLGDDAFVEPLALLCEEIGRLGPSGLGAVVVWETLADSLATRLRVLAAHPAAAKVTVPRPVVILGLHRTGTTLLQRLLAALPGARSPRFAELVRPASPSERRGHARRMLRATRWLSPEMEAVHPIPGPDAPEECWPLLLPTLTAAHLALQHDVPRYAAWLWAADTRPAYRFHRAALQLLLAEESGDHLVLKCPEHLWFLDALVAVYPEARFVWCHRDPTTCAASYASLAGLNRRMVLGRVTPPEVGPHVVAGYALGLERALAFREAEEARFVDVHHADLREDPVAVARSIHEALDLGWSEAHHRAASRWLADRPRGPVHRYDERAWGVHREREPAAFAAYRARFGVPEDPLAAPSGAYWGGEG